MNKAMVKVFENGREARRAGKKLADCPYEDHRTHTGSVTWARAFLRQWQEGWIEEDIRLRETQK